MSYCEQANQYIDDVLSGKIIACKWVKLACQRQKDELKNGVKGYVFDKARAERVCEFVYFIPHVKGRVKGQKVPLSGWWVFIYTTLFGWVDENVNRRYKTAYISVARKNSKSTGISPLLLYLAFADKEGGAEVYSAATTKDQAGILYRTARNMVKGCPELKNGLGLEIAGGNIEKSSAGSIYQTDTNSTIQALSRDQGGNLDGLDIHGAGIDELHAHKTRDVWDVCETATSARTQPLIIAITTAGFNLSGICYEQETYVKKILNKTVQDDSYFGIIFTLDEEDLQDKERLFTDEKLWQKANPNYGLSVNPEDIKRKALKASQMSSAQSNFLTKHLNVWVNADSAWLDMIKWDKCKAELEITDYTDWDAYLAVDLASKNDIACIAILLKKENQYRLFVDSFINEEAAEYNQNSQYYGWVQDGYMIETDGNVTDYAVIEEHIMEYMEILSVREVIFDPWQAAYISQNLMRSGVNVIDYRQTVQLMSEPMKELGALIQSGKIKHDGNPCTTWQFSNVVAHVDAKENIFPRKEQPQNKIDAAVATIMALGRASLNENNKIDNVSDLIDFG
ncbi:MAG: terminase large subunit [Xanthomonadales bacterium]|nr:terminase large subunit [Xanthomonadales bacterium]